MSFYDPYTHGYYYEPDEPGAYSSYWRRSRPYVYNSFDRLGDRLGDFFNPSPPPGSFRGYSPNIFVGSWVNGTYYPPGAFERLYSGGSFWDDDPYDYIPPRARGGRRTSFGTYGNESFEDFYGHPRDIHEVHDDQTSRERERQRREREENHNGSRGRDPDPPQNGGGRGRRARFANEERGRGGGGRSPLPRSPQRNGGRGDAGGRRDRRDRRPTASFSARWGNNRDGGEWTYDYGPQEGGGYGTTERTRSWGNGFGFLGSGNRTRRRSGRRRSRLSGLFGNWFGGGGSYSGRYGDPYAGAYRGGYGGYGSYW